MRESSYEGKDSNQRLCLLGYVLAEENQSKLMEIEGEIQYLIVIEVILPFEKQIR